MSPGPPAFRGCLEQRGGEMEDRPEMWTEVCVWGGGEEVRGRQEKGVPSKEDRTAVSVSAQPQAEEVA